MKHPESLNKLIKLMLIFVLMHTLTEIIHFICYLAVVVVRVVYMQAFDPIQDFKQSRKLAHAAVIHGFYEEMKKRENIKKP